MQRVKAICLASWRQTKKLTLSGINRPRPQKYSSHGVLHFECAPHGVHHAAEFDDRTIAGALDDAAMVHGGCGINQVAGADEERTLARLRALRSAKLTDLLRALGADCPWRGLASLAGSLQIGRRAVADDIRD